jgi:uncharacterized iron-regulated protein
MGAQGKRVGVWACGRVGVRDMQNRSPRQRLNWLIVGRMTREFPYADTPIRPYADTFPPARPYADTFPQIAETFPPVRRDVSPAMRSIMLSLTLTLWLGLVSCASRSGIERGGASALANEQLWLAIEKAEVIYVGETHDDPADHRYELELIRGLLKRKTKFAIGWEMFDLTQQEAIDAWDSRAISLAEMLSKTDFQKHWGIYSPAYEQILKIAGSANIPNLALNAPPDLARKIARGEPLTAAERAMVPTGFVATERGYRNFVAMMGNHPGMNERDQRRFFDAQNVWDQTMASRILQFKDRNPKVQLVVLTGRGHVSSGYGIPFYVRQKSNWPQITLLPDWGNVSACGRVGERELYRSAFAGLRNSALAYGWRDSLYADTPIRRHVSAGRPHVSSP